MGLGLEGFADLSCRLSLFHGLGFRVYHGLGSLGLTPQS